MNNMFMELSQNELYELSAGGKSTGWSIMGG